MKEHIGLPFFQEDGDSENKQPQQEMDAWTYATTFGDQWEIVVNEDGILTAKKKDAI